MNEQFSQRGKKFSECLGEKRVMKEFSTTDMEKLEECVMLYADTRPNADLYVDYAAENERTSASLRFPLRNHSFKDQYIGWLIFKSKARSSTF